RSKGTRDWQMIYTISGAGVVEDDPQIYHCQEGDLVLIPPGTKHEYYTAENHVWEKLWCHFTPRPSFFNWLQLPKENRGVLYMQLGQTEIRQQVWKSFERVIYYNDVSKGPLAQELAINALEET